MSNAAKAIGGPQERPCPVCGFHATPRKGRQRSLPQHRRYFSLMHAVLHHWPETHERQFADIHELRAWLQMKAGWRDVAAQIPIVGMPRDKTIMIVEAAIRAAGSNALPVLHGSTMVIFKPRSISFATMGPQEFGHLNDEVERVIRQETGLEPDQLMKETENNP